MLCALTRDVSSSIEDCELTFLSRNEIDVPTATLQHRAYQQCLSRLGLQIISLPEAPALPDAVFVEDAAVVTNEVAVVSLMGVESRRPEAQTVAGVLRQYRPLKYIEAPGTLEGGDVVRVGRTLYVGLSGRTNLVGISQLRGLLEPYDYQVRSVEVQGCLHLSTGCSYLGCDTVLLNREWVDASPFKHLRVFDVPGAEPWAANTMPIGGVVLMASCFYETKALLEAHDFEVITTDISELQKAEAGLTCMSIIFNDNLPRSTQSVLF